MAAFRRLAAVGLVACGLLTPVGPRHAVAQDDGAATQPFPDLEVHYGLTPQEVLDILSSRSLMLSREEAALIEDAKLVAAEFAASRASLEDLTGLDAPLYGRVDSLDGEPAETGPLPDLRLDAILYLSPESWTVWINGEALTPAAMPASYRIGAIGPRSVEIAWQPEGAAARRFVLEPGQVYVAATGAVVEADEAGGLAAAVTAPAGDAGSDAQEPEPETVEPVAEPEDLVLSAEQAEELRQLQQALSIVSGNAAALGMSEQDLQALQESLAASGSTGTLSAEQQEQLRAVQQATGLTP